MKFLIIGGAGFLGANLVRRCLQVPGAQVTVLDSLEPRLKVDTSSLADVRDRIEFVHGSLSDQPLLADLVEGQDVVFNCAGQTSHPLSLHDPLFDAELNCLGSLRLLEAVRLRDRKAIVVYASSSTVIGRAEREVVDESHGEKPLDIYSANKGVAEKYYRIYHRVHDLKTVVLRFANLYGPWGRGYPDFGFVNYFIHQAWADRTLDVFGSGLQTRNVLYAEDAADILLHAAGDARLIGETYFAVHDEHFTVMEIARLIVDTLGRGRIRQVEWPDERRRIEIDRVRISGERLCRITGWRPLYTFHEGLLRTKSLLEAREAARVTA